MKEKINIILSLVNQFKYFCSHIVICMDNSNTQKETKLKKNKLDLVRRSKKKSFSLKRKALPTFTSAKSKAKPEKQDKFPQ